MIVFDRELTHVKGYIAGTHRTRPPAETLREYTRLMPKMGITRLADVTGLDTIGMPVYVCIRPNSRSLAASQGKGLDHDSAKASALMESIESWHGERVRGVVRNDSYQSLVRDDHAIDAAACPLRLGGMFRPDAPIFWVRGWDMLHGHETWIPYDLITNNFVDSPGYNANFVISSNGLSSGNHLLEAILHGVCEVLERDAYAVWKARSTAAKAATKVDLSTVDDPICQGALELFARADIRVAAWDITSDVGVPAYTVIITEGVARERWRTLGPTGGHGCHPSRGVALMRALSEAAQSRATMISGSRDDMLYRKYVTFGNDDSTRHWEEAMTAPSAVDFRHRASIATSTFEGDLAVILERLRSIGVCNVGVCDLSDPDIGIPVVKVVVPGVEGSTDHAGYVPGPRALAAQRSS